MESQIRQFYLVPCILRKSHQSKEQVWGLGIYNVFLWQGQRRGTGVSVLLPHTVIMSYTAVCLLMTRGCHNPPIRPNWLSVCVNCHTLSRVCIGCPWQQLFLAHNKVTLRSLEVNSVHTTKPNLSTVVSILCVRFISYDVHVHHC